MVCWAPIVLAGCAESERDGTSAPGAQSAETAAPWAPADPEQNLDCYLEAKDAAFITDYEAFSLCWGAVSVAPVRCFALARKKTSLTDFDIINLCRCAVSTAPVACYERADAETFLTDFEMVTLCSATNTRRLLPNCYPYGGWPAPHPYAWPPQDP